MQKTKTSSLAVGLFSILNILLSIVLVTKFDLNIKGVAYGTLFSALITSIIFLIYMFWYLSKYTKITINFAQIFNLKKIKNIFNINLNIFIRTILLTFSFLWFTYLGTQIGENYVAANAILINLVFLSAFILDAYAFSTEGIVGYSLGKKDLNLFKNIVKNSFILSSISGLIISIIFFFTNNLVINLMSDIDEIRKLSSSYAVWLIILPVISSFCYQFDGIFIGASQTKELRNAMIFSVFSYLLISILLIKFLFNTGIWISLCIFMILRAKHQCGSGKKEEVVKLYEGFENVEVEEFFDNPNLLIDWSDFVISRSGALSLSETMSMNKGSLMIPLPNAIDNHQFFNAKYIEEKGMGIIHEQKNGIENLKAVINLILNEKKYLVWQKINFEINHTDAAKNIVSSILNQSTE